jgi:hypothetical protein
MLANYLAARRQDGWQPLGEAATRLVNALRLVPDADDDLLGRVLNAKFESVRRQVNAGGLDYSANLTALRWFLEFADRQAEALTTTCGLVHDEQVEFEPEFTRLADMLRGANPDHAPSPLGLRLPTDRLLSLEFRRSEVSVGLQLADCLAAAARRSLSNPARDALLDAFQHLCRLSGGDHFPRVIGPLDWEVRSLGTLIGFESISDRLHAR